MAGTRPPSDFAKASLEIESVAAGRRFGRIYPDVHPNPLGYGKSSSRFSDPRRRAPLNRFGVVYLGETSRVCFLETVLRDQRDGHVGDLTINRTELMQRRYAEIEVKSDLKLVDLRDHHAIRMGVPTDVARATNQTLARWWSVAFHEHPSRPDGIIYPSRLDGSTNIAIYDRAIAKLQAIRLVPLLLAPGLADILDDLRIGFAEPR